MKRRALLIGLLAVTMLFSVGAIDSYLANRMELFTTNPLSLGHADSDEGIVIHKFGRNDEPTAADDVWDCSETAIGGPAVYPFQSSAFSLYASSDNAGDTSQTITVEGLDANWERVQEDVDLDGQNFELVGTASNWLRVFRAYNASATALLGNVYLGLDATGTLGVPTNVATTLQACIQIGNGQTLMAIYTTADDEQTWITQFCSTVLDITPGTPGYATLLPQIRLNLPATQSWRVSTTFGLGADGTSDRCQVLHPPMYLAERTDVKFTIEGVSLDYITSTFNMVIIKK